MAESGVGWTAGFCGSESEWASPDHPSKSEAVNWTGIGLEEATTEVGEEEVIEGRVIILSILVPQMVQKFAPSATGLPHLVQNINATSNTHAKAEINAKPESVKVCRDWVLGLILPEYPPSRIVLRPVFPWGTFPVGSRRSPSPNPPPCRSVGSRIGNRSGPPAGGPNGYRSPHITLGLKIHKIA